MKKKNRGGGVAVPQKKNRGEGAASPQKGKGKRYWKILAGLVGLSVILNLLACFQGFCDWYKGTIYAWISDGLGVITGWFPFPLGEILGYAGALALIIGILILPALLVLRKKARFRRFAVTYGKGLLMLVVVILFVYTLNWIIPFRSSILTVRGAKERKYSILEVQNVRNYIVGQLNECAKQVERDENGNVVYDREAMSKAVFTAMKAKAKEYPCLTGYYPPMKDALCSDFLKWMGIGGYTYPYTMEITWNVYCTDLYYPFLLAHEASHHQGYYQENEANYIAFLACTQSEDPLIRYAGYNEIYYYIDNAYVNTIYSAMEAEEAAELYEQQAQPGRQVYLDRSYARKKSVEKYESVSHPAQKLQETSAKVADVGWSVQGDILQENSYHGVVKMVLQFYDVKEGGLDTPF